MPRRSILREVQEAAYAPRKKPSPAPLVLSLLLPLLLIPAVLPIVDLLVSSRFDELQVELTPANAASPPDLTLSVTADGVISGTALPGLVAHHELPSAFAALAIDSPSVHLVISLEAGIETVVSLLEVLQSCDVGSVSLSSGTPAPGEPPPSGAFRHGAPGR